MVKKIKRYNLFTRYITENNKHLLVYFVLFFILFPIAYTQSPLFTSNQNQYFLHGFAKANFGYLNQDWLANTIDSTPLFSLLIEWSYRIFHAKFIFYLYYVVLIGVYITSITYIVSNTFNFRASGPEIFFFVTLFFMVNSECFRYFLFRAISDNWRYILEDGVADQRLLGPVFQPSSFGVLLLLSIVLFIKGKPFWAVFVAVLAASIHPTYLLSAATLTSAYILLEFYKTRKVLKPSILGLFALILVMPIVSYILLNITNTSPSVTKKAQDILVNYRIPHHALLSWWFDFTVVIKLILIVSSLFLIRKKKLFWILSLPAFLALLFTIIQYFTNSNTLALIFPWRVTTFLVPISTAIIIAAIISTVVDKHSTFLQSHIKAIKSICLVFIMSITIIGFAKTVIEFEQKLKEENQKIYQIVRDNLNSEGTYLIPIKMQDFRLITGAPAYIDFKSIPYQGDEVLEWYRRVQLAKSFEKQGDCHALNIITSTTHISWIITKKIWLGQPCEKMELVYQNENYKLFQIK